jgi:hypothetical protein
LFHLRGFSKGDGVRERESEGREKESMRERERHYEGCGDAMEKGLAER